MRILQVAFSKCFSKSKTDDLESQKAALLYGQSGMSLGISLVNGVILSIVQWHRVSPPIVIAWLTCLIVITILRIQLIQAYKNDRGSNEQAWVPLYGFGVLCSGALWGMAGYLFFAGQDPLYLSFIVFILGGMTAGSVAVLSPIHYMPTLYIVPALIPLAACFVAQGDIVSLGMALLVCCYGTILLMSGRRTHRALVQTLELSLKNRELLSVISDEKLRVEQAYAELSVEVARRTRAQNELKKAAALLTQKNLELDQALKIATTASEAKSNFLAIASHEIRTPMNAIIGMTDLVLDSELTLSQREQLSVAKSAASSLMVIINDVLDFAKIESGKLEIMKEPFSLNQLLLELEKMFAVSAQEKGVDLYFVTHGEIAESLIGDVDRLRQVLINLIGNSIKFTERNGVILCLIESVTVKGQAISLRFGVSDSGIGIPPEMLEQIFDSFTQAEKYATRLYGGTGLGLAISHRLVAMMGGELRVKSIRGRGSQFYFTLPFAISIRTQAAIASSDSLPGGSIATDLPKLDLNVLVVEDNVINQKLFDVMLKKLGCRVKLAGNGVEAMESISNKDFDIVLMDCQMPVMDGYEATKLIRNSEMKSKKRLPIIALTAHALPSDRKRCLEVGMDEYLTKPVDRTQLFKTLARLTGHLT